MKATDVFMPQGTPTITLVKEPVSDEDSQGFDDAIEEKGKLIRVIGPSKSGKTVFVESKASGRRLIRVSVAGVSDPNDLWRRVLAAAGAAAQITETQGVENTSGVEVGGKAGIEVPYIGGARAEGSLSTERTKANAVSKTIAQDPLHSVVAELGNAYAWVFIDDFHYADEHLQKQLAKQIKYASEQRVQLIVALVPGRNEDVIKSNSDLDGRYVTVEFNYWEIDELAQIAEAGFPVLGIQLDPGDAKLLAKEAAGTPQLMQAICLTLARECGARNKLDPPVRISLSHGLVASVCRKLAKSQAAFSSTIEAMEKGPPPKGQPRKTYSQGRNVYQLLVQALGMNPPMLILTKDEIQKRVNELAGTEVSSAWESIKHMTSIANKMHESRKLEVSDDLRQLYILDPYLFFALRWRGGAD